MTVNDKNFSDTVEPSFQSLVSSIYSAVLYNLGEVKIRGMEEVEQNLDMARFNIGLLEMLKEKTEGNLEPEEKNLLDNLLSTARLKFVEHTKETKES